MKNDILLSHKDFLPFQKWGCCWHVAVEKDIECTESKIDDNQHINETNMPNLDKNIEKKVNDKA